MKIARELSSATCASQGSNPSACLGPGPASLFRRWLLTWFFMSCLFAARQGAAAPLWDDNDYVIAISTGMVVLDENFNFKAERCFCEPLQGLGFGSLDWMLNGDLLVGLNARDASFGPFRYNRDGVQLQWHSLPGSGVGPGDYKASFLPNEIFLSQTIFGANGGINCGARRFKLGSNSGQEFVSMKSWGGLAVVPRKNGAHELWVASEQEVGGMGIFPLGATGQILGTGVVWLNVGAASVNMIYDPVTHRVLFSDYQDGRIRAMDVETRTVAKVYSIPASQTNFNVFTGITTGPNGIVVGIESHHLYMNWYGNRVGLSIWNADGSGYRFINLDGFPGRDMYSLAATNYAIPYNIVWTGNSPQFRNSAPSVTCPSPVVRDCVPPAGLSFNFTVGVSDADLGQQVTVALKEGSTVLRTQTLSMPAAGTQVTFSSVVVLPGSHTLTAQVSDGLATSACQFGVQLNPAGIPGTVVARHVFYNQSAFDGNDPAANAADDAAIAPDKQPLLPGNQAVAANYTSYSKGINGIVIDVAGLAQPSAITAADFVFTTGNDSLPDAWIPANPPAGVTVRAGASACGADRILIVWDAYGSGTPNAAVGQGWLKVRVLANSRTGLSQDDVFYFGNAIGEGDDADTVVAVQDALRTLNRVTATAAIDNPLDFNRDGLVAVQDAILVLNHVWTGFRLPDLRPGAGSSSVAPWSASADAVLRTEARRLVTEAIAAGGAARFTSIRRLPDDSVSLAWELPAGRHARLLAGDEPSGPWRTLPKADLDAEGRLTLSGDDTARFYRLELLPVANE